MMAELVVFVVQCVYLREMLGKLVKKISIRENVLAAIASSAVLFLTKQILTNGTSAMQVFVNLVITAVVFFGVYGVVLLVQKRKVCSGNDGDGD